jgi:hypothetical protein
MEELHTDSIDGGHEASYGARSRARERAYSNNLTYVVGQIPMHLNVESADRCKGHRISV